jgi:hypothetical protein
MAAARKRTFNDHAKERYAFATLSYRTRPFELRLQVAVSLRASQVASK